MRTNIFNVLFHCGSDNLRKDYFEYSCKNLLVYVLCSGATRGSAGAQRSFAPPS